MKEDFPIVIYGPRRLHISLAIVGALGCFVGYMTYINVGFDEGHDHFTFIVLAMMLVWFTYRSFFPKTKLIFTKEGLWTKTHGWKKWEDFGGVAIEKQKRGRVMADVLLLLFEIEETPQELSYDFFNLSVSPSKFKKLLQGPLKPYMEL